MSRIKNIQALYGRVSGWFRPKKTHHFISLEARKGHNLALIINVFLHALKNWEREETRGYNSRNLCDFKTGGMKKKMVKRIYSYIFQKFRKLSQILLFFFFFMFHFLLLYNVGGSNVLLDAPDKRGVEVTWSKILFDIFPKFHAILRVKASLLPFHVV